MGDRSTELYAESSAVLAWLLGERSGNVVRRALGEAEIVVSSELTLIECERVLIRATAMGHLDDGEAARRRETLARASDHWTILAIDSEIVERARRTFPREPVRTLDAIHLASAIVTRGAAPQVGLLSLDARIRANALELGFELVPRSFRK